MGKAVAGAFFDHWNDGDAEGIGALFAEDADFVNVVGLWWRSRKAIRKAHNYGFRRIFHKAKVEVTELAERTPTLDIHIVHTVSTLDGQTAEDGSAAGRRMAVISMVARRGPPGLEIVSCQNTDRGAGADTHVTNNGDSRRVSYRS